MIFATLILLAPGAIFIYYTIRYWRKIQDKKIRYTRTRKALMWIFIDLLTSIAVGYYAFYILSQGPGKSFLLTSSFYYLALDILCVLAYVIILRANSKRNILKLFYWILLCSLYLPMIWWNYDVLSAGISNGKIGFSKYMLHNIIGNEVGGLVNYQIISVKNEKNGWNTLVYLQTKDNSAIVERQYFVNKKNGKIELKENEKKVKISIIKKDAVKLDGIEMMLLADKSVALDATETYRSVDYAVSDEKGEAFITVINENNQDLKFMVHDCGKSCSNHYYVFKFPFKDTYTLDLDSIQSAITEL